MVQYYCSPGGLGTVMDNMNSVRCKACDKPFASVWYEDKQAWEELCWECLTAAFAEGLDDDEVEEIICGYDSESRDTTPDY